MNDCIFQVKAAEITRGTNPCQNTEQSLLEALEVVDCCRRKNRFDLAAELLNVVRSFPRGHSEPIASRVTVQQEKIERRDTSANEPISELIGIGSELPRLRERILTFASSALRHAVDGFQRCETSEIENRLSICRECPNLVNDHCIVCGCACVPDAYLSKVAWRSEKCPEGKW